MYYILTKNKQILVCSLVCPITNTEANLRCPTPTIHYDSDVFEIEGDSNGYSKSKSSNISTEKSSIELGLLSELVNSNAPEFDPTQVNGYIVSNGQDLSKLIGLKFICKDKKKEPCQAKVIKVNKETGKVILKYVQRG